ncbi:hypothetical protein SAMN04489868_1557 [Pisciglobus halotolerans]|uniref:Uncharacterized protein n=1 Tax=Pisciglobus halotolerans TaxID=745365 RepID=A0A1I3DWC0_9LACT|nr:hypothetical protein SAMN04489868_1557 [Pisciglobus halotolerans]
MMNTSILFLGVSLLIIVVAASAFYFSSLKVEPIRVRVSDDHKL